MYYVSVYEIDRAYGGPEEGGWWYDTGIPSIEHADLNKQFENGDDAQDYADSIRKQVQQFNYDEDRKPVHDSRCNGYLTVAVEDEPPKAYPAETPHYE